MLTSSTLYRRRRRWHDRKPRRCWIKAGFHMIADDRRRSQTIADRRSQTIANDRRQSQTIAEAIVCDHDRRIADDRRTFWDLRSAIIWKPALRPEQKTWWDKMMGDYGVVSEWKENFRLSQPTPSLFSGDKSISYAPAGDKQLVIHSIMSVPRVVVVYKRLRI